MQKINIISLLNSPEILKNFYSDMKNGAICAIPTDTVYGFAVDASNSIAVEKLYHLKKRSKNKPLILFISKITELKKLAIDISDKDYIYLNNVWPGAITVILNKSANHEELKAFDFSTIGVRVPAHDYLLELLANYKGYFLTTSVNLSSDKPIILPSEIEKKFGNKIDWLIENYKPITSDIPSTIIDLTTNSLKLIRNGKDKVK